MSGSFLNPSSFSLDTALSNLQDSFGSITAMIGAISFITGLSLVARGLMMYRALANQTMASAQRGELAGPAVFIFVGAILIYLPSAMQTSLITVFGSSSITPVTDILSYSQLFGTEKWAELAKVVAGYMKIIGLIAFVRGWVILSKMGHSGSQPGSVGKGMIHVIGGILLVNVVDTVSILAQTFGYTG